MGKDYVWRELTAGNTADYVGRALTATNTADYVGRAVATVWAVSTAYAEGDAVELSTGEGLVAVVGGTSAAVTEPAAPGYGNTVIDGTVTWEQVTGPA